MAVASKAKDLFPKSFAPHGLLGQLAMAREHYAEALGHFDSVVALEPRYQLMRALRAMAMLKLERAEEAKAEAELVRDDDPARYVAIKVIGLYFDAKKDYGVAEGHFRRALELKPDDAEGYTLLGKVLVEQDKDSEAKDVLKRAIKLNPKAPAPFYIMGSLWRRDCHFRRGFSFFRHAYSLDPTSEATNINYAVGLTDTGRVHEAIRILKAYIEEHPAAPLPRFNLSNFQLLIGQLDEGWRNYEARRVHYRGAELPLPEWDGKPTSDKTLMVRAEQGIGDEIFAASMFDDIVRMAGHCVIECEPRLYSLFSRSFPEITFTPKQKGKVVLPTDKQPDAWCWSWSLPRWVRGNIDKFPGKVGYIVPEAGRAEFWRWRLAQLGPGLKVGVAWRSIMNKGTRRDNYTTLAEWSEIFATPDAVFVNLQYGECQEELDEASALFGVDIVNFEGIDLKDGQEDVAALISGLDVVVGACNAVTILGGALNVPVLQFVTSSNWNCLGTDHDPWYPNTRALFRAWDRDWSEVLHAAAVDLRRRSHEHLRQGVAAAMEGDENAMLMRRIGRGKLLFNNGKVGEVRRICEGILAVRPDHADALILSGVVAESLGERDSAEAAYRRVIELEPLYAEAYNHLGVLLLKAGRVDDAIAEFGTAIDLQPTFMEALNNLGSAHAAKANMAEALKWYRRAITTYSGYMMARYNYALALEDSGRASEAIVEYETVVESNPKHADAWNNLGNLYGRLKRDEDAIAAYRRAISAAPTHVGARFNLATRILMTAGDAGEAIELLKTAAQDRTDDVKILKTLGVAYAMNGDLDAAIENLKAAMTLAPADPDIHRNLGLALQKAGRLEEAKAVLTQGVLLKAAEKERLPPSDGPA